MKRLRGAVIGYGFISAGGHIPAYLERRKAKDDVEIAAIADVCEARRKKAAAALPGARIYDRFEALLEKEGGSLDFIDIATPPVDHAAIAKAALERGLHVLCEKPITPTVEEAKMLLDTAARVRRVFYPCHNYKHAPVVKTIRSIIDSGRIGRVRSISMTTFRNTHAKGVAEWNTDWRRDRAISGGGIAMDHGSHTFYLAFDWMGALPTRVTATMAALEPYGAPPSVANGCGSYPDPRSLRSLAAPQPRFDTEDNFSCVLTFPNGLVNAHLTWTAGVRKVVYALQGEKGAITVSDDDLELSLMRSATGPKAVNGYTFEIEKSTIPSDWMDASHVTWFNSLFDEFSQAISTNDFVSKTANEAYRCIDLINAAYRSARNGSLEQSLAGA